MAKHCPECEEKIEQGQKHCSECGHDLKEFWEEEKNISKRAEKKSDESFNWKLIGGIGAIAIILAFLFFTGKIGGSSGTPSITKEDYAAGSTQTKRCSDVQVPYETQEEYMKTEYYTETVPYTDQECENKKLVYNVEDFAMDYQTCLKTEDKCIKYTLGICTQKETYCIDKEISCSLTINNLDNENGYWYFDFQFKDAATNNIAETNSRGSSIYPQSSQLYQASAEFTGRENAEKTYTCTYSFTNIPTKQVCRDVIKYKEIQKTRQVTAYKPVTKYKTEQKCN